MTSRVNRLLLSISLFVAALTLTVSTGSVRAQMFGLEEEPVAASNETATGATTAATTPLQRLYERYLGEGSLYKPIILAVVTLLVLVNLKR